MKRTLLALATLLGLTSALFAWDTRDTPTLPDGTPIQLVLPPSEHMQNVGGSDGAGLCVYTSVTLAARWQNGTEALSLRKFAEGRPGGSYPEKLADDLKVYAQRYNVVIPNFVQHTGGDDAFLDLALATRRMPGVTYAGADDFYDGPILHMVNLVHLDATHGAIQDNNRAGRWTSDTRTHVLNRWKGLDNNGKDLLVPARDGLRTVWVPAGGGWAFVWLNAPPPPKPPSTADSQIVNVAARHTGHWERAVIEDQAVWLYWVNGELRGGFQNGVWHQMAVVHDWAGQPHYKVLVEDVAPAGLSPPTAEPTDDWNKGVESWRFDRRNRYWINGTEVSQIKAYAAVSEPTGLTDDSDRYHLTLVGADKKTVDALFHGPLAVYAPRVHVQVYAAGDWPTNYLTSPVTLQEPAKMGGRIVATGKGVDDLPTVLAVFDKPAQIGAVENHGCGCTVQPRTTLWWWWFGGALVVPALAVVFLALRARR